MKVAANDVERILMAAQAADAVDAREPIRDELSFTDRVAAFKRAQELQDTPIHWRRVRGRKNGKYRQVLVLHGSIAVAGHIYRKCLVPYTDAELDGRRVTRVLRRGIMHKRYKPITDVMGRVLRQPEAPWPCHFHIQNIREDRIEELP